MRMRMLQVENVIVEHRCDLVRVLLKGGFSHMHVQDLPLHTPASLLCRFKM